MEEDEEVACFAASDDDNSADGIDADSADGFAAGSDLMDVPTGLTWAGHWPSWVVTIARYLDCYGNVP